jgi:hypothetical protein
MRISIRILVALVYIIIKHIILFSSSILALIWYMDIKYIKQIYKDSHVFYISTLFHSLERYRYNTLRDFVFDIKDYRYRWNK